MDGYLKRAITYIKDPAHKTTVRLATAGVTIASDALIMYAVNADNKDGSSVPYVGCKAISAGVFLSIIVPKLTDMVAKASSDLEAHLKYQSLNFAYCLGELGMYNITGAPDPVESWGTFLAISSVGGAALTHITRHPGLGRHLRASGEHALEALFWIGRTFSTGGKMVYNGGKAVTSVVGSATRAMHKPSIDDLFDDTDASRFYPGSD